MAIDTTSYVIGAQTKLVTIQQLWDEILYGLIIVIMLWLVYKYATCRILVEIHEKVRGGYIGRKGRFGRAMDKTSGLHYLSSMWGGRKLPYFNPKYYIKIFSIPLIGVNRQISIIRLNDYSYKVIMPPSGVEGEAEGIDVDTQTWVFLKEKADFLKRFKQSEFWQKFQIYAPLVIILGSILFWIYMIYLQNQLIKAETNELVQTMEVYRQIVIANAKQTVVVQ